MKDNQYGSLMATTLSLLDIALKDRGMTLIGIFKETDIPYYWLKKFSAGDFANPSVNRVQALYEFLSGEKLKLVA